MKRIASILVLLCTVALTALAAAPPPFTTTTIDGNHLADGTEWYVLTISNSYLYADQNGKLCASTAAPQTLGDNYLWCFEGTAKEFRIYNKKVGTSRVLGFKGKFPDWHNHPCDFVSDCTYSFRYTDKDGLFVKSDGMRVLRVTTEGEVLFIRDAYKPAIKFMPIAEATAALQKAQEAAAEAAAAELAAKKAEWKAKADPVPFEYSTLTEGRFGPGAKFYYIHGMGKYFCSSAQGRVTYEQDSSKPYIVGNDNFLWAFVPTDIDNLFYIYNKRDIEVRDIKASDYADVYYIKDGRIRPVDYEQFRRYNSLADFYPMTIEPFSQADVDQQQRENEAHERAAKAQKEKDKRTMLAKVGQANFNKLMNNEMPKGITISQLDAYASYVNTYYEETDHAIRFKKINDGIWEITLVKNNNAEKYENRVVYFHEYRVYLQGERVINYILLRSW